MKSRVLIFLLLCGAASAQIINPSGGGSGSGFTAPDGWVAGSGNFTAGSSGLTNTVTRTCNGTGVCNVWNTTETITSAAGKDVRLNQLGGSVTGTANNGDTWGNQYNQVTYNLNNAAGVLTHGLHDIERGIFTSTALSTTTLWATGYFTAGMTNLNGITGDVQVVHAEWDAPLSGTGSFTNGLATYAAGLPGVITGSPTVPFFAAYLSGDVTTTGVPGTVKCGVSIGQPSTAGTYGICVPTPGNAYTNPIITGAGVNYFSGGLITGAVGSLHGSLSANTKVEISSNSTDAMIGYYNANGGLWEAGIGSGANGEFIIKNTAGSATPVTINKNDNHIDFAGQVYANSNRVFVASDFTTAANTNLQNITGLTWTLPASQAENVSFTCSLPYSQATATAAVSFGISASVAPTQINASGEIYTSASVLAAGNLQALASTTATAIVTGTPSAITTIWNANIRGFIENPSTTASTITIMVKTATSGDAVTVKRGGFCVLGS